MTEINKKRLLLAVACIFLFIFAFTFPSILDYLTVIGHRVKPGPNDEVKTIFSFDSDRIIITKFDLNKVEDGTVTVKDEERKRLLKIFERDRDYYDCNRKEENFDYQYKLDFGRAIGYLNMGDKEFLVEHNGCFKMTDEECKEIESFFQ